LFTWVQGADFYRDHLRSAVELLPPAEGETLLDIGCGPGLLTRLAAARGYRAVGLDADQNMVAAAKRIAFRERSTATFETVDLHASPTRLTPADVVAAASLLAVMADRRTALDLLWRTVAPGGLLLVVEATEDMTVRAARQLLADGLPGRRSRLLIRWASGRAGRTVDPRIYEGLPDVTEKRFMPLIGGLAGAWLFRKNPVQALTALVNERRDG